MITKSLKWIFEVSKRFSRVDRKGRSAATSKLATLGICFGVMTLIVVMSIMNGFQMSSIDPLLEISSYHMRCENLPEEKEQNFLDFCNENKAVTVVTPFYEAQTLMVGKRNKESPAIIRAIDPEIYYDDIGFSKELRLIRGQFNLRSENAIILGSGIARDLGVTVGSEVNLLVLSGGNDVELFSGDRKFIVSGIFSSGYNEINSSYCFISIKNAEKYFGRDAKKIWGIKLADYNDDMHAITQFEKNFSQATLSTWREYNKSFFGALRIEKNILLLLVALIFVVVAINIYNGMRRLVFERRNEIAILSAVGAQKSDIKAIFVMRGFITGIIGAFSGVVLGLLISVNTEFVFTAAAKIMYGLQYVTTAIFNKENLSYLQENSSYLLYSTIPARIYFKEVLLISLFGIISPVFACWAASKNVLNMTVAEVLHDE